MFVQFGKSSTTDFPCRQIVSLISPSFLPRLSTEFPAGLTSQFNGFECLSKPDNDVIFIFLLVDIFQGEINIPILSAESVL